MAKARNDASAGQTPSDAGATTEIDAAARDAASEPTTLPAPDAGAAVVDTPAGPVDGTTTPAEALAPAETPAAPVVAPQEPATDPITVLLAERDAEIADLRQRLSDAGLDLDAERQKLEAARKGFDAELEALHARFDAAWRRRESEIEAAGGQRAERPAATSIGAVAVAPFVGHSSVTYRGKVYEPGAPFPFDPRHPPSDVSSSFVEGLDYVYR